MYRRELTGICSAEHMGSRFCSANQLCDFEQCSFSELRYRTEVGLMMPIMGV